MHWLPLLFSKINMVNHLANVFGATSLTCKRSYAICVQTNVTDVFLPLTSPSTVVVQLTSCRDDSVVCCRSAVPLRSSGGEHRTETILLSAVVLPYRYCRRAANIARRRFGCLLSFCRTATAVVRRTSHGDDYVVPSF